MEENTLLGMLLGGTALATVAFGVWYDHAGDQELEQVTHGMYQRIGVSQPGVQLDGSYVACIRVPVPFSGYEDARAEADLAVRAEYKEVMGTDISPDVVFTPYIFDADWVTQPQAHEATTFLYMQGVPGLARSELYHCVRIPGPDTSLQVADGSTLDDTGNLETRLE